MAPVETRTLISENSDADLLAMLAAPTEWRLDVLDAARAELVKRGIDVDAALPKAEDSLKRADRERLGSKWSRALIDMLQDPERELAPPTRRAAQEILALRRVAIPGAARNPGAPTMPTPVSPAKPAPILRRGLANFIDYVVLGVPLVLLGRIFFETAADLGDAGRLIGAAAVAFYFGAFESAWGRGMSLGKAWLGLQVVDLSGGFLSPTRAAARALVAFAPVLLNGVSVPTLALGCLVYLIIAGLGLAEVYLAILNRPSRRCPHDLVFSTMVVTRDSGVPAPSRLAWVHVVVVAMLLVFVAAVPATVSSLIGASDLADGVAAEAARRVAALPDVASADTVVQRTWSTVGRSERLIVTAELRRWPADSAALAKAAAEAIFRGDERLIVPCPVTLRLHQGFTFGVADSEREESYPLDAD